MLCIHAANTIQPQKKWSTYLLQHRWTLKTCWEEEAKHKTPLAYKVWIKQIDGHRKMCSCWGPKDKGGGDLGVKEKQEISTED